MGRRTAYSGKDEQKKDHHSHEDNQGGQKHEDKQKDAQAQAHTGRDDATGHGSKAVLVLYGIDETMAVDMPHDRNKRVFLYERDSTQ